MKALKLYYHQNVLNNHNSILIQGLTKKVRERRGRLNTCVDRKKQNSAITINDIHGKLIYWFEFFLHTGSLEQKLFLHRNFSISGVHTITNRAKF